MTDLDRDQIKRDADDVIEGKAAWSHASSHLLRVVTPTRLARYCLALLAALEQAERERGRQAEIASMYQRGGQQFGVENHQLEARLAKVPALVEALTNLMEKAVRARNLAAAPDYDEEAIVRCLWDLVSSVIATDQALADYEGEQ